MSYLILAGSPPFVSLHMALRFRMHTRLIIGLRDNCFAPGTAKAPFFVRSMRTIHVLWTFRSLSVGWHAQADGLRWIPWLHDGADPKTLWAL